MTAIKQAIEALDGLLSDPGPDYIKSSKWDKARAALAALRSMPAEPYAYAVYFPDQPTEELVHDLDELLEDMTNREHTITELFATPHTAPVPLSDAEIDAIFNEYHNPQETPWDNWRRFARAIEHAVIGEKA